MSVKHLTTSDNSHEIAMRMLQYDMEDPKTVAHFMKVTKQLRHDPDALFQTAYCLGAMSMLGHMAEGRIGVLKPS